MKTIIEDGSKGFLFKNGKFIKMLNAGKYITFGNSCIYRGVIGDGNINLPFDVQILTQDPSFNEQTVCFRAESGKLTLHFTNGVFRGILVPGQYFFWTKSRNHTFTVLDLNNPEFPADFPEYLYSTPQVLPYVHRVEVSEKEKALLYHNGKFVRLLDPGTYYFLKGTVKTETETVDACLCQQEITGQEILSADKVSLRVNCTCSYRITDYVKVKTLTDDYKAQLHTAVQLALRDFIGERRLDEILAAKNELSSYLSARLSEKGKELYICVEEAAVKDIILPGEIRDIMNTVLVAEKRAQANVITRREEVASTRSLLNTARLMDENATLYKLKELEYIERICEKVGNINLNGNVDLLTQLTGLLAGEKRSEKRD